MDEGGGGRGWEKLAPEERTKLRVGEYASVWGAELNDETEANDDRVDVDSGGDEDDYGWGEPSASR